MKGDENLNQIEEEENKIVDKIAEILNKDKPWNLRRVRSRVNLFYEGFKNDIEKWYGKDNIQTLEMDLLFGFESLPKHLDPNVIDDTTLVAAEVKFFKELRKRHFREGIEQSLAYALFGPDKLCLWHLFSNDIKNERVQEFTSAANELIEGLKLPIIYIAGKISNEEKMLIKGVYSSVNDYESELKSFIHPLSEARKRNPLLANEKVRKRREILKALLIHSK